MGDVKIFHYYRFAPINGSDAANYFERMAYIEERFYE